jgi:single-strand DNA-binding protein
MDLNIVKIKGNLTKDPEFKHTASGKAVCGISIASNHGYSKNGKRTTEVSYFDIEAWGVIAENCAKYLKKGNGVIIEGRLKQDRWEKDGKTQSRIKISASNVQFLFDKKDKVSKHATEEEGSGPVPTQSLFQ